ncbi:hypothetical protein [Paenibacillus sp. WLX2291]|uniref:hypothetical protein n=1 Tax=Paenibacillus sp. WLX2291 TaxID=3296934 RepID=UPI00398428F0
MKTMWKVLSGSAFSAVLLAGTVSTATFVSAAPGGGPGGQGGNGNNGRAAQVQQGPAAFGPGSQQQQDRNQAQSTSSNSTTATTAERPAPPSNSNGEAPTPPALPNADAHGKHVDGNITAISGSTITVERPTPPTPPVKADKSTTTDTSTKATKTTKTDKSAKTGKTSDRPASVQRDTYGENKPVKPLPSVGNDTYGGSTTVTVTDSTYIVKVSGDPKSGITETKLSLSDLNVGDHISVILESDSKQAARIEVREAPEAPADGKGLPKPPTPGKDAPTPPDGPPAPPVATNESTSSES